MPLNDGIIGLKRGQQQTATFTLTFSVAASAAAGTTINGSVQYYPGGATYSPPSAGLGAQTPSNESQSIGVAYVSATPSTDALLNFVVNFQTQQYAVDLAASVKTSGAVGYLFQPAIALQASTPWYPQMTLLAAAPSTAYTQYVFLTVLRVGLG